MIKGKAPYPFETIALAVSFSPVLPILVDEMRRLCTLHNSQAVFIHAGKKTGEKQRELSLLLTANGFHDGNSRVYWEHGEAIPDILRVCKHEVVDLILVGASDKDNFMLPSGHIAKGIATRAKCSVMVISSPVINGFKKIVVNGSENKKTESTILTAAYFAEKENIKEILLVEDISSISVAVSQGQHPEKSQWPIPENIQQAISQSNISLNVILLAKGESTKITEYAFRNEADLVITHSSDHKLLIFDRISEEDGIESLMDELTCNLLVIHSRISD